MFSRHKHSSPLAGPTKWYVAAEPATATDADAHEQARAEADALVEDYLDHVSAGLLFLPRARRMEIRREIGQHIVALARAHEELNDAPLKAAQTALVRFGDPAKIVRSFSRAWKQPVSAQEATAFPGAALKQGLLWFGGAGLFVISSLFTITALAPLGANTQLASEWVAMIVLLLPIMAGWRVGQAAPARASVGTFYALSLLTFAASLIASRMSGGELYRPFDDLPVVAALMFALWMPLGCAAAAVSGARAWWRRSARFRLVR